MKNDLLKSIMKRDGMSKYEAIEMIMEEFDCCNMDAEETLHNLGYEPDYCFDLIDIVASN